MSELLKQLSLVGQAAGGVFLPMNLLIRMPLSRSKTFTTADSIWNFSKRMHKHPSRRMS